MVLEGEQGGLDRLVLGADVDMVMTTMRHNLDIAQQALAAAIESLDEFDDLRLPQCPRKRHYD